MGTIGSLVSAAKSAIGDEAESIAGKFSEVKGAITSVIGKVQDAVAALGGGDSPPDEPPPYSPPVDKTPKPEPKKEYKRIGNFKADTSAIDAVRDVVSQVDQSKEAVQRHIDDMKRRGGNPAAIAKLEAFLKSTGPTKSSTMSSSQNTTSATEIQFPWIPVVVGAAIVAGLAYWKFWWKPI